MDDKNNLKDIIHAYNLGEDVKERLVTALVNKPNKEVQVEIEKYRIDRMIEEGLIKQKRPIDIRWEKILDDGIEIIKGAKFYYILAMILTFTTVIFNSANYWKYENKNLDYEKRTK